MAEHDPERLRWWERQACSIAKIGAMPRHVAFIMDGNRRFAHNRGIEVAEGHRMGYEKLEEVRAAATRSPEAQ